MQTRKQYETGLTAWSSQGVTCKPVRTASHQDNGKDASIDNCVSLQWGNNKAAHILANPHRTRPNSDHSRKQSSIYKLGGLAKRPCGENYLLGTQLYTQSSGSKWSMVHWSTTSTK